VSVSLSIFSFMAAHFGLTDIFKFDPNYLENEEKYKAIKNEILGEDSDEESGSEESSDEDSEGEEGGMYYSFILDLLLTFTQLRKRKVSTTRPELTSSTSAGQSTSRS